MFIQHQQCTATSKEHSVYLALQSSKDLSCPFFHQYSPDPGEEGRGDMHIVPTTHIANKAQTL